MLAQVIDRIADLGETIRVTTEIGFYLIDPERDGDGLPQASIFPGRRARADSRQVYAMADLETAAPLLDSVERACATQNIPANVASSAYAPGQMEINLDHVGAPLLAADHAVLLQRVIRAAAREAGLAATFMAKSFLAEKGSGLHFHGSHYGEDGRNLFDDGMETGSNHLRHAIGGLGETMAIFGPNVNSWRRLSASVFAGTAFSWGPNNRMTNVRLPVEGSQARRFEHRIADANPYLTLAALLAGMHHGITNRIDPGPPQAGDNRPESGDLPTNWPAALDRMAASKVLRDYFGDAYVATKRGEIERFFAESPKLEYDWYLAAC